MTFLLPLLILGACKEDDLHCHDDSTRCYEVGLGRYLAVEPEGWDGQTAIPVMVFFHGHGGSAGGAAASYDWLVDGVSAWGGLLVLPDGLDGSWSHQGSPEQERDEDVFVDQIMADAAQRWPLTERRYVSGFSSGGSMAWHVACYRGDDFTAFLPISGSFWEPLPGDCGGPVSLRHTHGTEDTIMPLEGRAIGDSHQGDVYEGMALWREMNGCAEEPDEVVVQGEVTCQMWQSCSSGEQLALCLHGGKHAAPEGWIDDALPWADALAQ